MREMIIILQMQVLTADQCIAHHLQVAAALVLLQHRLWHDFIRALVVRVASARELLRRGDDSLDLTLLLGQHACVVGRDHV